jgi:hypothetical protein
MALGSCDGQMPPIHMCSMCKKQLHHVQPARLRSDVHGRVQQMLKVRISSVNLLQ